jgi:ubiquinone/menaquinone biosynthesis C-methylase UbiE
MVAVTGSDDELNTRYSDRFVEALRPSKPGKWLDDELRRADKIMAREQAIVEHYISIRGQRLLDFGCGAGASAAVWGRMGAMVTGVEPDAQLAEAAKLRVADEGLEKRVDIVHVPNTRQLPFDDGHFQVCVCNAVIEHIPPRQRAAHITEIWRVLAPGGYFYITETPNRLCPYDGHTTRLWGIPWVPLKLARRYAIWRGRVEPQTSEEDLVKMGIRGTTYFEIARALRGCGFAIARRRGRDEVESSVDLERPQSMVLRWAKRAYVAVFHLLERTLCRWADIPVAALLPDLTLCLKKLPDTGQV